MSETISIDDFKKVEICVGEILSAEPVEGSEKLLKLKVNFGLQPSVEGLVEQETRQVVSGIAKHFPNPNDLIGKKCAFVTNLAPRKIMGLESQAMILAAGGDSVPGSEAGAPEVFEPLHLFESTAIPGSRAR